MTVWMLTMTLTAQAGDSLPERLAERATQPDVVLVPPIGEPSPAAGSFLVPADADDPAKAGTFDTARSSCTDVLTFKTVKASEKREELWMVESGIGARLGLPQFGIQIGGGTKSMAGIRYDIADKLVLDGGIAELEMCCLKSPDKCTDRYITEYWRGTGALYKMTGSDSAMKSTLKGLDKLGKVDFGTTKGWSSSSEWADPQYFAYRVERFQLPSCEAYMNDLPEVQGKVLFTGVSKRVPSEQEARRDARSDARQQVVRYMGEEFSIEGDEVISKAEALVSGIKDGLTCIDDPQATPEGPQYLARVRMYVDKEKLEAVVADMEKK